MYSAGFAIAMFFASILMCHIRQSTIESVIVGERVGTAWEGQYKFRVQGREWGYLFALYIFLLLIRSFLIVVFFPCVSRIGLKSNWQESMFMSWGGLRYVDDANVFGMTDELASLTPCFDYVYSQRCRWYCSRHFVGESMEECCSGEPRD